MEKRTRANQLDSAFTSLSTQRLKGYLDENESVLENLAFGEFIDEI